jgi:hypothetical protein
MRVQNREGIHVMQLLRMTQTIPWMTRRENVPERELHMKKLDAEQTPSLRSIVRTHTSHHDQTRTEAEIERQTMDKATERIIQVEPTRVKRQVGYRGLPPRVYLLERLKRFVSIKSQAAGTVKRVRGYWQPQPELQRCRECLTRTISRAREPEVERR